MYILDVKLTNFQCGGINHSFLEELVTQDILGKTRNARTNRYILFNACVCARENASFKNLSFFYRYPETGLGVWIKILITKIPCHR